MEERKADERIQVRVKCMDASEHTFQAHQLQKVQELKSTISRVYSCPSGIAASYCGNSNPSHIPRQAAQGRRNTPTLQSIPSLSSSQIEDGYVLHLVISPPPEPGQTPRTESRRPEGREGMDATSRRLGELPAGLGIVQHLMGSLGSTIYCVRVADMGTFNRRLQYQQNAQSTDHSR